MFNRSAASYAISAVVITASTVALVLVASTFAYQTLEQQRGTSEFNLATNSLVAFDDAVRDVAWSLKGSRNTRFSIDYGQLTLFPNDAEHGLNLDVAVRVGNEVFIQNYTTGYVKFSMPTKYITFGQSAPFYILGNDQTIITRGTEDLGCLLVSQESGWVSAILTYRTRAMETSTITLNDNTKISYVNILVIKMEISEYSEYVGDLDLTAKVNHLTTVSSPEYLVPGSKQCFLDVQFGDQNSQEMIEVNHESDKVVFNFIISEMEISP